MRNWGKDMLPGPRRVGPTLRRKWPANPPALVPRFPPAVALAAHNAFIALPALGLEIITMDYCIVETRDK